MTINKSQQIRDYAAANPTATAREISTTLGVKPTYVHTILWKTKQKPAEKKSAPKKGRPAPKKWKTLHISTSDNSVEQAMQDEVTSTNAQRMMELAYQAGKGRIRNPQIEIPITMEEPEAERVEDHPLYAIFYAAIEQAMFGKGERHGGARTPFFEQPWAHYVKLHGRGFATGQAAKKLEEAATTRTGVPFEQEVFGAMVYLGMAVLEDRRREVELKR